MASLSDTALGEHCGRCAHALGHVLSPSLSVARFALLALVDHHDTRHGYGRRRYAARLSGGSIVCAAVALGMVVWMIRPLAALLFP